MWKYQENLLEMTESRYPRGGEIQHMQFYLKATFETPSRPQKDFKLFVFTRC